MDASLQHAERASQERFTALEQRLATETTELSRHIEVLGERVDTVTTRFEAYTRTTGEQLAALQQQCETLDQVTTGQGSRLAYNEDLERRVNEQQAKIARYEQLEPLLAHVGDLQRLATERQAGD